MSFSDLVKRLKMDGEKFILQVRKKSDVRNEIGDFVYEWTDIYELEGIIQRPSNFEESHRGEEELISHKGFFVSNFEIPLEKLGNYRIKHKIPTVVPQERLYQIVAINRDLRLRRKQNHYEMDLNLNKRW